MVIAKQVPPEHQESPLEFTSNNFDLCYPGVILTGNRNFFAHITDEYKLTVDNLYDAQDAIHALGSKESEYVNEAEVITEFFPPLNKDRYEYSEIEQWIRLLVVANDCRDYVYIAEALSLITGCKYEYTMIRGCNQSDWQYMLYPSDQYGENFVREFEAEYFNLGSEWVVDDEHCYIHASGYDMEEVRDELCRVYGLSPDEIQLLRFEGWKKTATYEEVIFDD